MPKSKDYTGMKFGRLTAIQFSGKYYNSKRIWTFQCECGTICDKLMEKVVKGWTTSCGCAKGKYSGEMAVAYGVFLDSYADSDLTFEQFYTLSQRPCYWCGKPPSNQRKGRTKVNHVFTYNGLDRIDNQRGHDSDNVLPCCWICNEKRSDDSYDDFVKWIETVYLNRCI